MKKAYSAPDIVFESFSLSVSIAACAIETNHGEDDCGYKWDGETIIFTADVGACADNFVIEDGSQEWNGLCYDNPTSDKRLFGS